MLDSWAVRPDKDWTHDHIESNNVFCLAILHRADVTTWPDKPYGPFAKPEEGYP